MSVSITYSELPRVLRSERPEDEERIVALAQAQFASPYYSSRGDLVRALAVIGKRHRARHAEIVQMLRAGLQAALWRGERREGGQPGLDANFIGVSAAAVALAHLNASEVVPELNAALTAVADEAVHYELAQCAGAIAVSLTVLKSDSSAVVEPVLADFHGKWAARHSFVNQLRYAMWVMRGDRAGAQAWLENESEGRPYASAAIADMGERATPAAVLGLDLWHANEPTGEFPHLYAVTFEG
ncbi:MAG: hypothetical protein ACAI38_15865 [Myxococcota bacterium]